MRKIEIASGTRFVRLLVKKENGRNKWGQVQFSCVCDCGKKCNAVGSYLLSGQVQSCGCLGRETLQRGRGRRGAASPTFRHGNCTRFYKSPEYMTWMGIVQRCTNPKNPNYPNYGGKGVRISARWRESFQSFLADVGPRPAGTTLGRYLDSGAYELRNVEWQTKAEQTAEARGKRAMRKARAWHESMRRAA